MNRNMGVNPYYILNSSEEDIVITILVLPSWKFLLFEVKSYKIGQTDSEKCFTDVYTGIKRGLRFRD